MFNLEQYDVVYIHDHQKSNKIVIASACPTLLSAKEQRKASGDLVVFHGTDRIVQDDNWLWDWEKRSVDCYAREKMNGRVLWPRR